MLEATRRSSWKSEWTLSRDGVSLVTVKGSMWKQGATFTLAGREYRVSANWTGSQYALLDAGPTGDPDLPLATAERVGRKNWTVAADGRTHRFRRASIWRSDQELLDDADRAVGRVRRTNAWHTRAEADLPGLPEPVQVFAFAVVLLMWEMASAAAATTAAT